jgi:hypothetical protein
MHRAIRDTLVGGLLSSPLKAVQAVPSQQRMIFFLCCCSVPREWSEGECDEPSIFALINANLVARTLASEVTEHPKLYSYSPSYNWPEI